MMKKHIKHLFIAAGFALFIAPGLAMAHGNGHDKEPKIKGSMVNDLGVKIWEENNRGQGFNAIMPALFYKGKVTAISTTGFTMQTNENQTFTVNTANAKIIRLPSTNISLADIKVDDRVYVNGNVSGTTIDGQVIYEMQGTVKPAAARGTVTAVNGNNITLQTKNNKTVNVTASSNTQVKVAGQPATMASVTTGSKVKVLGLWDQVVNTFTAIKIKVW